MYLDVLNLDSIKKTILENKITHIVHLAAILRCEYTLFLV